MDEDISGDASGKWTVESLEHALEILLGTSNTNFASLIKAIHNNKELYRLVFDIIIGGKAISYNDDNPIIALGITHGFLARG